jgi:hypothetical protein
LVLRRYARRMIRARTMPSATLNGVARFRQRHDQFPPLRLSACSRFSQETFAGTRGNGEVAP